MRSSCVVVVLMAALTLAGCGSGESAESQFAAMRQRFVAPVQSDDAAPIETIREQLAEGTLSADHEIVLRGRINAGDISPWEPDQAAFIVTDATGHHEYDDPHECPFCSRKIECLIARVEFRDDSGKIVGVDARKLFDLEDKQLVVVRGHGSIDESGILVVAASDMFINR